MINIDDKILRNLEEQVRKNQKDIKTLKFGLHIVGKVDNVPDLPSNAAIGDAFLVGREAPYYIYIKTANPKTYDNIGTLQSTIEGPRGFAGAKGEPGRGIIAATIDRNGVLTLSYSDGTEERLSTLQGIPGRPGRTGPKGDSIVGPQGPQGPRGENGKSFELIGIVEGTSALPAPESLKNPMAAYLVGTSYENYHIYIQVNKEWKDAGPIGIQGPEGKVGPQGPKGDIGAKGDTGAQGEPGEQGIQGPEGKQGIQGIIGPRGLQGPQGIQGPAGIQGPKGEIGPRGETGPRGEIGPKGDIGPTGLQGPQGIQGPKGEPGRNGNDFSITGQVNSVSELPKASPSYLSVAYFVGKSAPRNVYWCNGTEWIDQGKLEGPTGPQGPQGIQGKQGKEGPVGPKGDKGDTGAQGIQGIQGERGEIGPQGPQGDIGKEGPRGQQGIQGPAGPQGKTGPQGPQGKPGKDGVSGLKLYNHILELSSSIHAYFYLYVITTSNTPITNFENLWDANVISTKLASDYPLYPENYTQTCNLTLINDTIPAEVYVTYVDKTRTMIADKITDWTEIDILEV